MEEEDDEDCTVIAFSRLFGLVSVPLVERADSRELAAAAAGSGFRILG